MTRGEFFDVVDAVFKSKQDENKQTLEVAYIWPRGCYRLAWYYGDKIIRCKGLDISEEFLAQRDMDVVVMQLESCFNAVKETYDEAMLYG